MLPLVRDGASPYRLPVWMYVSGKKPCSGQVPSYTKLALIGLGLHLLTLR